MPTHQYPARFTPEPGGAFTVTFPDLPEAITSGRSLEEALMEAQDCLRVALAGRLADGVALPPPGSPAPGLRLVQTVLPQP